MMGGCFKKEKKESSLLNAHALLASFFLNRCFIEVRDAQAKWHGVYVCYKEETFPILQPLWPLIHV
jgi:hypothetical protein